MVKHNENFERFPREYAQLTSDQKAALAWRSIIRMLPQGLRRQHANNSIRVLRQALVAQLFMAGRTEITMLERAANATRPSFDGYWSTSSDRPAVDRAANDMCKCLVGNDGAGFGPPSMVIASTGISNSVPESHFILDDIRQIKASVAGAWQKAPTELPEILPLTPEHTSGLVPEQEGRHLHPFWNKWYQSVIAGTAPNWGLINRIAQIDDAAWEEGAATLDKAIDDAVDDLSIAMTENGETVEINPETGKLRLVPTADLSEEMGIYVRRKMLKAIAVFEQPLPQSHRALTPDLAMLQCAVEDAQNLPVELYDACSSALLRLALRAEQGECPSVDSDPLLADYRNRLRDAGADILGSNAGARRVLERRQAITDNDALINGCDTINEVVATVAPLLEGRLAETLPQDAAIATDPNSDPAERRSASFRLSGRLLRILRFTAAIARGAGLTFRALTKGAELLEAMQFLAGNPIVKDAQRIIYEMLNLR